MRDDGGASAPLDDGLRISVTNDGDAASVAVTGEIDLLTADRFRSGLADAVSSAERVAVDLESVTFMDSTGIASLAWALRHAEEHGCSLTVTAASHRVRQVLDLTQMSSLVGLAPDDRLSRGASRPGGPGST